MLILFNTVGYVYVLNWYQHELDRKAEELIDAHVSEISGNLIFTVPVTEASQATDDKHLDGEIRFEGTTYRMVKQRVQGNMLYIVCVKDNTQEATDEINEIIAAVSGQSSKQNSAESKVLSSLLKYCDISMESALTNSGGWIRQFVFAEHEDDYRYNNIRSLFHPPAVG